MTRITLCLPEDCADWLSGYAACRKVSPSRVVSDLLLDKRATLSQEVTELSLAQEAFERILQSKSFLELSKQIPVPKTLK